MESLGAKVVCAAACFGEYDYVVVVDYPNEVAALKGSGVRDGTRCRPRSDTSGLPHRRLHQGDE